MKQLFATAAILLAMGCSTDTGRAADNSGGDGEGSDFGTGSGTDSGFDTSEDTDSSTGSMEAPATCDEAIATKSNIGCEYWAVDLDNAENSFNGAPVDTAAGGQFAVAVANIGDHGAANVTVHLNNGLQGQAHQLEVVESASIPERDLYIFRLPRRDVDGDSIKVGVDDGPQTWLSSRAFRITSDVPVVAYQFNTLNQKFSNDASLLLPTSGLGKDHLVLGISPSGPIAPTPKNRGYITIVGAYENTSVEVVPSFDIMAGEGIDAIAKDQKATFDIGPFDVINLETRLMNTSDMLSGNEPDLSGSTVISDKPVSVFFGTDLSLITNTDKFEDSGYAEHVEQQILPSEAMGMKYVVSHSAQRTSPAEEDFYRIMAYSDGTTVTTNLPAPNNSFTLNAGGFQEFFINTGFVVDSSGPLHVAQFLVAGGDAGNIGDSSLLYVPAVDQRRGLYIFTTGNGFSSNHAVISMPSGTSAKIDDNDVATTCTGPLNDGDLEGVSYESWTCDIEDGTHAIHSGASPEAADVPIGVLVYGYYNAGSYSYPAGSDLRQINPDVLVK